MTSDRGDIGEEDLAGCPIDPVLRFFALKWLVHIVWLLGQRTEMRFSELQQDLGTISAKVLTERLKQLEALSIIDREDRGVMPPHVAYRLSSRGRALDEFLRRVEQDAQHLSLPEIHLLSGASDSREN